MPQPIVYLITSGATTANTTPDTESFSRILFLIEAAVSAGIPLIQIREKNLSARVLFELARRAASLTQGTGSRLLINDRADIASAAGADGVQLTTRSLRPDVIRKAFGPDFLIGVSTHSLAEACAARDASADFVLFGPIFDTESKRQFGEPQGLDRLAAVTASLKNFPVIAIGGITDTNLAACFQSGASGIAAIRMLQNAAELSSLLDHIRKVFETVATRGK